MRKIGIVAVLFATRVFAQTCPCPPSEIVTNEVPSPRSCGGIHFVWNDGTALIESRGPVAPQTLNGTVVVGARAFPVSLNLAATTRFAMSTGGKCIPVKSAPGWTDPGATVIDGRTLDIHMPQYVCEDASHGTVVCFGVTGDVNPADPPPGFMCPTDRIETACGPLS